MKLKTILSTSGCIAANMLLIQKQLQKEKHTNKIGYRGGSDDIAEVVETDPQTYLTDFCEEGGFKVLDEQLPSNFSFVLKNPKFISQLIIEFIGIVITYIILTPRLYRFALGAEKIIKEEEAPKQKTIKEEEAPKQKTILRVTIAAIVFGIVKLFLNLLLVEKRSLQYDGNQIVKNYQLYSGPNLNMISGVFMIPLFMITQPGLIYKFNNNGKLKWGRSKNYDFVSEFIHANVFWLLGTTVSSFLIQYPLNLLAKKILNLKDTNYKKPLPKCWEAAFSSSTSSK